MATSVMWLSSGLTPVCLSLITGVAVIVVQCGQAGPSNTYLFLFFLFFSDCIYSFERETA